MSDKKRSRRRKDEYTGPGGVQEESDKPSKEEYAVAKWLKNNVRTKRTKFLSHNVEYFTATKALDALMNSKFSDGDNCLFPTREHAIEFLDLMLEHRFFHRAKKVPVYLEDLKSGGGSGSCGSSCGASSSGGKSKNQQKESSSSSSAAAAASSTTAAATTATVSTTSNTSGSSNVSGTSSATTLQQTTVTKRDTQHKDEKDKDKSDNLECCGGQVSAEGCGGSGVQGEEQTKEKRKRKIKLDMHPEQVFVDGSEAYVWIYDPVPIHYWIYGLALVLGAILLCLFPLWPPILRKGVYYLSVAAAGFLVFILVLTIVRLIIFVIVWILSGGKLYLWIFPNLTEDVGFLASFWPLYESEYYVESGGSSKSNKKSKKKKKDKDSDAEDEMNVNGGKNGSGNQQKRPLQLEIEKIENIKENETGSIPLLSKLPPSPLPSDLITGNDISNDDNNVNDVDQNYDDGDDDDYDDNYKGDDDDESEENCINNTIQNNDRDNNDDSLNVDDDDNKKKKKISKINLTNIKKNDDKVTGKSTVTVTTTTTTTTTSSADKKENTTPSESESEGSRSSTGKDFEILDATEVADDPDAET